MAESVKSSHIILRVGPDVKERVATAAAQVGLTVSRFVLNGVMREVERIEQSPERPPERTPGKPDSDDRRIVPTFIRASFCSAQEGGQGYGIPGRQVGGALASLVTDHCGSFEEAQAELDTLRPLLYTPRGQIKKRDDAAVLAWLDEHLPGIMALAPARRRPQFLKGFYEAANEDDICLL